MKGKRNALGKGLSALLESAETDITTGVTAGDKDVVVGSIARLKISQIEANPFQPRTEFDQEKLEELAASIRSLDIIQPVTVRKMGYDKYQLISGERRFRAAQMAGLEDIPAYIRVANDQAMLEIALVENIQREDLDAIEVALSCQRLIDECSLTQEAVSEKLGKKRSTVTNYLRLLTLPPEVQNAIKENKITMGHARAITGIKDEEQQMKLFHSLVNQQLSVREAEDLARKSSPAARKQRPDLPDHLKTIRERLSGHFGTNVGIKQRGGKGKITIPFASEKELNDILDALGL